MGAKGPEVDVVLVAFNGGDALAASVDSVLASRGVQPRVVVVDNASTDGSCKSLARPGVSVVTLPTNVGYGAGFNAGLAHGTAAWVACANQDTIVGPDTVRTLIDGIDSRDRPKGVPVIAAPRILRPDGSTTETGHKLPSYRQMFWDLALGAGRYRNAVAPSDDAMVPLACDWVSAVFIVARRATFENLGGFDPDYFMYAEDIDLFRRLQEMGGTCVWDPRVAVVHTGGVDPSARGAIPAKLYALTIWNLKKYFEKYEPSSGSTRGRAMLAAGAAGCLLRSFCWSVRATVAPMRPGVREGSTNAVASDFARMFAGAAWWCSLASVTGRLPAGVTRYVARLQRGERSERRGRRAKVTRGPQDLDDQSGRNSRVVFYARTSDLRLLDMIEFYAEDLRSLESLGFEVVRSNSPRMAARAQGDVLYAWWWHSALPVMLAWRLRGRAVVGTGVCHMFENHSEDHLRWWIRSVVTAVATRLSSVNIAVSSVELGKLRRVRAPSLELMRCSVDTSVYRPTRKTAAPSAIVLGQMYPANIRRKGVDTALAAVLEVLTATPQFCLRLVGPVTAEGAALLRRMGADAPGIEIVGEVARERKAELLAESWFCLQPSVYEGFGVAVLEAMASGTVPICSKGGALVEVVGDAGIVLEEVSPRSVAAAIRDLIVDRGRLEELSLRARQRALEFDSTRHTQQLAAILRSHGVRVPADRSETQDQLMKPAG